MQESRVWRLEDLADELQVSIRAVSEMLHELGYHKIASRYVPHELTCEQCRNRKEICEMHLN
jgi:Mn-dependent DtxR family transcriptional regulator